MYTFEKNIPIPPRYPFPDLQPGESVLYPSQIPAAKRKAYKAAHMHATRKGWEFAIRLLPDGVRMWRVS